MSNPRCRGSVLSAKDKFTMPELWQSYSSEADPVHLKTDGLHFSARSCFLPLLLTRVLFRTEALLLQRRMPCSCRAGSRTGPSAWLHLARRGCQWITGREAF